MENRAQRAAQAQAAYTPYYPQSAYYPPAALAPGQAPLQPTDGTDTSVQPSAEASTAYTASSYPGYEASAAYYGYYAGYPYGYDYSQYAQTAVPGAEQRGSEQANKYREKTEVDPLLAGIQEVNVNEELRKAHTPTPEKRTFAQFVSAEAVRLPCGGGRHLPVQAEVDMEDETPAKRARTEERTTPATTSKEAAPLKLVDYPDDVVRAFLSACPSSSPSHQLPPPDPSGQRLHPLPHMEHSRRPWTRLQRARSDRQPPSLHETPHQVLCPTRSLRR